MDEVSDMQTVSADGLAVGRPSMRRRDVWIIVCKDFHRAVGPIPTERLAAGLAAYASEIGVCTYRPVRLALAEGVAAGRADDETPLIGQPKGTKERPR
jgi:hypothetical protein